MEAIICLSIFIVASSIWAFYKTKEQRQRSQGGWVGYFEDYEDEEE